MARLDTVPILPAPLAHQPQPNINVYIDQINPWVTYHLRTTIESNVHYESQLHGPFNAFLESIFPISRQFMVIPQALLREVLDPMGGDSDTENDGDRSFGSTGGDHKSRNTPGSEPNKAVPDFLIVKVVPKRPGAPRDYRIVTMIELKRDEKERDEAERQTQRYMDRIDDICSPDNDFRGFLVMQDKVVVYGYGTFGTRAPACLDEYSMFALGDLFTTDLANIALRYWNGA